jgi:hypothetical protein
VHQNTAARLSRLIVEEVRNDLLKAIYATMLVEVPWPQVAVFWRRHPFPYKSRPAEAPDFFRFLWDGDNGLPSAYFWSVVQNLQTYLESLGLDADRFFELVNHGPMGGPPLNSKWLAEVVVPAKKNPLTADPREWLLAETAPFLHRLFPGSRSDLIRTGRDGDFRFALLLFHPLPSEALHLLDFRLFPGRMLAALPRAFGGSAFDKMEMLADTRGPGLVAGSREWNWKGDALRFRRRCVGRLCRFSAVLESLCGNAAPPQIPDRQVVIMDKDFHEPEGGRILLRRGCAYGAPVHLIRVGFRERGKWKKLSDALALRGPRSATAPAESQRPGIDMLERLHKEFVSGLEDPRNLSIQ